MRARAPITAPGAATSTIAALLYLGTCPDNGTAICALMSTRPKHTTSHVRIVAGKSATQSRDSGPILKTGRASILADPPFPGGGPPGLRTQFEDRKSPREKSNRKTFAFFFFVFFLDL